MQVEVYVNRERRERGGDFIDFSAFSAPSVVNYTCQGEGAPVIMIHGLAASLHDWDFLIPDLVAAGYEACALDLLGHGESYKPARLEDYNAENVFNHLSTWIESLNLAESPNHSDSLTPADSLNRPDSLTPADSLNRPDSLILIGHSLGGYLALDYALRFPDHVRALILVNPFYSTRQLSAFLQLIFHRQLLNTSLIERTPYWLFRVAIDVTSLHFGGGGDGIHTLAEDVRIQTALDYKRADPGIYNVPRTMRDLTADLPRVSAPALVIWGARDQTLAPASFPELVRLLPNARGETLVPCGHVPHQCHADKFNRLVMDFLADL